MVSFAPAALREVNAAAYLDLSVTKFRNLVSNGALPAPIRLADGVERWKADELLAILNGSAARPSDWPRPGAVMRKFRRSPVRVQKWSPITANARVAKRSANQRKSVVNEVGTEGDQNETVGVACGSQPNSAPKREKPPALSADGFFKQINALRLVPKAGLEPARYH